MEEEIIVGKNPIIQAIKAKRPIKKLLMSNQLNKQTEQDIRTLIKKHLQTAPKVQKVPMQTLNKQSQGRHQGLIAYIEPYEYATIEEILQEAQNKNELPFIVILDEIEDPHNLGAILRTADATGVHGVIIPKNRAVGLTETVAKASAGAIEHVKVARVTNIVRTIEHLKKEHVWVVGTDDEKSEDYRTLDGETALAIVIGNEGRGISRLVKENCDWLVHIPMKGAIPSLNASVATSIVLYEVVRKRQPLGDP